MRGLEKFCPVVKASFQVGTEERHKVSVLFSPFGKELYFVDESLILSRRSFSSKGVFKCEIGQQEHHSVKIVVKATPWSCKVFVDGNLYIQELFPELPALGLHPHFIITLCPYLIAGILISGTTRGWYHFLTPQLAVFSIATGFIFTALLCIYWRKPTMKRFPWLVASVVLMNSISSTFRDERGASFQSLALVLLATSTILLFFSRRVLRFVNGQPSN